MGLRSNINILFVKSFLILAFLTDLHEMLKHHLYSETITVYHGTNGNFLIDVEIIRDQG